MYIKHLLTLGLGIGLTTSSLLAQTVFTVGKEAVSKAEFLSWYQKNNSQNLKYDKASLENFANLYALYKMKVMEADALHLDTVPSLKNDIEMYRTQLAKNYISDKSMMEKMTKEAYDRMKQERQVAHIMLSGFGEETDANNAKKLEAVVEMINNGRLTFEQAAAQYSTDRGTASKGGNLGFINAMQTPYEFESVAYQTPVGKISKPFKSPYGYHILTVLAERPASGAAEVAQVLLSVDSKDATALAQKMELAKKIKAEAQAGKPFESLVTTYSDDTYSKDKKGVIPVVSTGSTDPLVEQAVFALKNPGEISEPVVTSYGVHLFKLISKKPLGSYEDEKANLTAKIERSRLEAIKQENLSSIKKNLGFKENATALAQLVEAVDQNDFNKDSKLGAYPQLTANMFEIGTQKYSQQDFLKYVQQLTQGKLNGTKQDAFKELYRVYTEKMLTDAQMKNLEKSNPEYKKLAGEYRNGVLIFDMMDKNIWSKANQDTAGLKAFYEKSADNYMWKPGFIGVVFQSKNHEALSQILTALKGGASVSEALKAVNTPANDEKIYQQTGRFDFEHVAKVDKSQIVANKPVGIAPDVKEGEVVIFADEVFNTPQRKTFAEARDVVVDDYQKFLEKNWETSLKSKYPMKLNGSVLNSLVK